MPVRLATVISTLRSAPREPGTAMAVGAAGRVLGSVSGGCVEGAVYELARDVIATGRAEVATYGVGDEDALMTGLTCGGTLEVFVEPVDPARWPEFPAVTSALRAGTPLAVATVVCSPDAERLGAHVVVGPTDIAPDRRHRRIADAARAMLQRGETGLIRPGAHRSPSTRTTT